MSESFGVWWATNNIVYILYLYPIIIFIAKVSFNVIIIFIFHITSSLCNKRVIKFNKIQNVIFNSQNYVSSAISWKKPPPKKSCSTQTGRKYLLEIAMRSCNPQYDDVTCIGDETPKVARAHATSIAFVR